jgi:hypothetical protein
LGNNTKRKKSGIVSETAIVSDLLSFWLIKQLSLNGTEQQQ